MVRRWLHITARTFDFKTSVRRLRKEFQIMHIGNKVMRNLGDLFLFFFSDVESNNKKPKAHWTHRIQKRRQALHTNDGSDKFKDSVRGSLQRVFSINIFPLARIQIGILIRLTVNFEHRRDRSVTKLARGLWAMSRCPPFWTPTTIKRTIRTYFTQRRSRCGLTEQMFQIPLVWPVWAVEKAPLPAHEVEGVHQVGATQVLGRGQGHPGGVENQQQQHGHRPWYSGHGKETFFWMEHKKKKSSHIK